jgi:hypothetical protein
MMDMKTAWIREARQNLSPLMKVERRHNLFARTSREYDTGPAGKSSLN